MEIFQKIFLSKNSRPILLQCESRNDNSLSKIQQSCKTNYSKNYLKDNYINIKNSDLKLKLNKKIPLSTKKIDISSNNNIKNEKNKETNNGYQVISYINIGKNIIQKNKKNNLHYNFSFNKNFTINNNVTNNISNHITNIIVTNNNNLNFKKKFFNNKKINLNEKNIILYNNINNNSKLQKPRTDESKNFGDKNNIQNRNSVDIKNKKYSDINRNNKLIKIYKSNDIHLSSRDKIFAQKFITSKDGKNKNIIERNNNKLKNKCFTTSSTNIIHKDNNNLKNSKITLIKKNILKENNNIKFKNLIDNIEIKSFKKKLRNSNKKLKQSNSINNIYNKNNQKVESKIRPSLKYLEDTISINNIKIKNKNQMKNLKRLNINKNYITNYSYNCNSSKGKEKNVNKNIHKSYININIDNIESYNELHSLINYRKKSISFIDKKNNNSLKSYAVTTRGNLQTNISKINKSFKSQKTKSKSKSKNNSKDKVYVFNNLKNKTKINLINNSNFKTERKLNNKTTKHIINNISKKINISNNKNESFIINYKKNLINNKSFIDRKKRQLMNTNTINLNIHKSLKKEFFTKTLIKKFEQSNLKNSFKTNNYNSYKGQYLNLVNSYKSLSYISQEKTNKNYNDKEKKNMYYNNQKKIHEKNISKIKKNNRCKKKSLDLSVINMHNNDLVSLVNIKYNKNNKKNKTKFITKEILKPIFYNKRKSPNYFIRNNKNIKKNFLSFEKNKKQTINFEEKKLASLPKHLLKNILNISSFNENCQESKINSARISHNCSTNNYLIKNYRNNIHNKNSYLDKHKSFKNSMNIVFNKPYNKSISLNKKNKLKINDIIQSTQKNEEIKSRKEKSLKNNKSKFEKKIEKDNNKNLETFEISDEDKSKENEKSKGIEKEKDNYGIDFNEKIKNNPQYLSDYIIDILDNLLLEELYYIKNKYINSDYLFSLKNQELTPEIRLVSINWLIMIHHKVFKFKEKTLFLCVQIIDRFLSKKMLNLESTELLILCSLILSSKHEEMDYVNMTESLQLSNSKFSKEQIINMEYEILNELDFEIIIPNMNDYYNIYAIILNLSHIEINKGLYLLNVVLIDYYMLEYPNYILALAVIKIIIKKSVKKLIEIVKDLIIKNNKLYLDINLDQQKIDKICDKIKLLYKKFIKTKYRSIQEKFSDEMYNSVSNNSDDLII